MKWVCQIYSILKLKGKTHNLTACCKKKLLTKLFLSPLSSIKLLLLPL